MDICRLPSSRVSDNVVAPQTVPPWPQQTPAPRDLDPLQAEAVVEHLPGVGADRDRAVHLRQEGQADDLAAEQQAVEGVEVLHGGHQGGRRPHPGHVVHAVVAGRVDHAEERLVDPRVRFLDPRPAGEGGVPQPGAFDDVPGDVPLGRGAGHVLQEPAEDHVVGVGVDAGRAAGLAGRGRREPHPDQLGRREVREPVAVQALRRDVRKGGESAQRRERGREIVGDAAGVVEQHPDGDPLPPSARHQPGQVAADRRVQLQVAPLGLLQDGRRDEGLGDAAHTLHHPGLDGTSALHVGHPGGAPPHPAGVAHLGVHARHPRATHGVQRGIQDLRPLPLTHC